MKFRAFIVAILIYVVGCSLGTKESEPVPLSSIASLSAGGGAFESSAGDCSGPHTIRSHGEDGRLARVAAATPVTLAGGEPGMFFADASCLKPLRDVVLAAGSDSATFFYKSHVPQEATLNVSVVGNPLSTSFVLKVAPRTSCSGLSPFPTGTRAVSIDFQGFIRRYTFYVPPSYSPNVPMPIVINLHGYGENGSLHNASSNMIQAAQQFRFLLIAPEGMSDPASPDDSQGWNSGNCCGFAKENSVDDVGFIAQIVHDVSKAMCVDPGRIYVTGFSNGASLAHRLACERSYLFAAIGAVSGGIQDLETVQVSPPRPIFTCQPLRPVPVIQIHGKADSCVPFGGGTQGLSPQDKRSIPDTIHDWAIRNGCSLTENVVTTVSEGNTNCTPSSNALDCAATCTTYSQCAARATVTLCTTENGGHVWPYYPQLYRFQWQCGGVLPQKITTTDILRLVLEHSM